MENIKRKQQKDFRTKRVVLIMLIKIITGKWFRR